MPDHGRRRLSRCQSGQCPGRSRRGGPGFRAQPGRSSRVERASPLEQRTVRGPRGGRRSCFSQIIILPLPELLTRIQARSYQGAQMPCFDPSGTNAVVSTLAGYHRAVSVDGGASHTLMGALRRLKVETWALLGYCEQDQEASQAVNACAAFEQAYSSIVVSNAENPALVPSFRYAPRKDALLAGSGDRSGF